MSNLRIKGYSGTETNLVLPTSIDGNKVTELEDLYQKNFVTVQGDVIQKLIYDEATENGAFYDCSSLTTASFPKCSYVEEGAFRGCNSLSSVYFPECSYVGEEAFNGCLSLIETSFPKCSYVASGAFYECSSLSSIYFPECSYIGQYAFYSCSSLSKVEFPKCQQMSEYAFRFCTALTTASFPMCSCIISPDGAGEPFRDCTNLTDLYFLSTSVVSTIVGDLFPTNPNLQHIYVPASLVDAYKTTRPWSGYASLITPYTGE